MDPRCRISNMVRNYLKKGKSNVETLLPFCSVSVILLIKRCIFSYVDNKSIKKDVTELKKSIIKNINFNCLVCNLCCRGVFLCTKFYLIVDFFSRKLFVSFSC